MLTAFVNALYPLPLVDRFFAQVGMPLPFALFTLQADVPKVVIRDVCLRVTSQRRGSSEKSHLEVGCAKELSQTGYQFAYLVAYPLLRNYRALESHTPFFLEKVHAFLGQACADEGEALARLSLVVNFADLDATVSQQAVEFSAEKNCLTNAIDTNPLRVRTSDS